MNTAPFKEKLEAEQDLLESQLRDLGVTAAEGWEAKAEEMDVAAPQAEPNEAADKIEDYEERQGEGRALAARLSEVKHALEKIENGKYGYCEVDNEPIEHERLEANPAARTCEAHL